jgi:hypothetical protein
MTEHDDLAALHRRIEALEARLAALEPSEPAGTDAPVSCSDPVDDPSATAVDAAVATSSHVPTTDTATGDRAAADVGAATDDGPLDRRTALRRLGTAAAGAVAAGTAAAVTTAGPAAAANGDPVAAGETTTATSPTDLVYAGGATNYPAFIVREDVDFQVSAALVGYAHNRFSTAVYGLTDKVGGAGGVFSSNAEGSYGVVANAVRAPLRLSPRGVPAPERTDAHLHGELVVDILDGDLWFCTAAGSPGTWRRLSGPETVGALTVLPTPVRVYDSRPNNPPNNVVKGPLANAASRAISCTNNSSGVPVGATAVLVNATVVNTSASGFLALYRNGIAYPGTSNVNWFTAGQVNANQAVVAVDAFARIAAYVPANASTDVIVDVIGYYR